MISHNVQPSKSSFSFALRACSFLKDGEEAVKVIRAAQLAGAATPFMYNSTLVLLDNMRRNDMALKMLRDILSIGASSDVAVPSNSTTYTSNPEDDSGYHLPSGGSSQPNRMRLPPGWLTRRIISNALQNLTENFSVYFTDVKNGRLSPSKELRPFVSDVAEVLKGTVHDRNLYLSTSAYPMANKILLDCEDFETLQSLLNHTLYKPEVNTTRLYEFALKSLLKDNPTQRSIDVILLLVTDIVKASIPQYASHLILDAMERLQVSKIKIPQQSYDASMSLATLSSKQTLPRGTIPKRGCDANEVLRANLLYQLFEKGKALIPGGLPKRAYVILALACKKANLPLLMLNLYKASQEDNIDDRMLKNAIVFTLARSSDHWDIAIEILEGMRKKNGGVSDLNMYYGAFSACDSGKDWEQAIYLLNRLQEDGHKLSTLSVTSVITVCSACGRADEALGLLRMMEEKNIVRTVWTYNAAIAACAKTGNWKGALSVFEKMRENSMEVKDSFEGAEDISNPQFDSAFIGMTDSPVSRRMSSDVLDVSDGALGMIDEGIEEKEEEEDEEEQEEEDEEEQEEEDEEEQEEEGWDERLNADFDDSFGTGNYRESNQNLEGIEEAGLFNGMRGVANQVTYNTLIEALGEGGQQILVDELYKEAVENNIVNPLSGFSKGYIDLHGHSVHMAKAAIRYTFEYMLSSKVDSEIDFTIRMEKSRVLKPLVAATCLPSYSAIPSGDATLESSDDVMTKSVPTKRRELVVIVGKGDKLVSSIQKLLTDEFHPPIRSHISKSNSGRLLLSDVDISKWLAIHNSVR
jgi:pentatricopeptide repeat protein